MLAGFRHSPHCDLEFGPQNYRAIRFTNDKEIEEDITYKDISKKKSCSTLGCNLHSPKYDITKCNQVTKPSTSHAAKTSAR